MLYTQFPERYPGIVQFKMYFEEMHRNFKKVYFEVKQRKRKKLILKSSKIKKELKVFVEFFRFTVAEI